MCEEPAMRKFFCKLVECCNADDPLDRSPHCKALDDSTLIMFTSTVSCAFFSMRDRTPRPRELGAVSGIIMDAPSLWAERYNR